MRIWMETLDNLDEMDKLIKIQLTKTDVRRKKKSG